MRIAFVSMIGSWLISFNQLYAQNQMNQPATLSTKQQSIVVIAALTAKGDLQKLQPALNSGLDAGLTINETKEVLVHLYAYCGFPRSIRGLQTLMTVLDERKKRGITDKPGKEATPITSTGSKYERGKKVLEQLTGQPETGPKRGYAAFSPEIEVFLKEHLFADLFERDVLSYTDRELTTIAVLASVGGVEPMLQAHLSIGLNVGLTESQFQQVLALIETNVGQAEAEAGRAVLTQVMALRRSSLGASAQTETTTERGAIFPKGQRAPATNFTGTVWVQQLIEPDSAFNIPVGYVTFEPGARSHWHSHPGGQVLLAMGGIGYYQERGKPIQILRKGDAVKCPPNVPHWHGASPTVEFLQVAITPNTATGRVTWMQPVTNAEYTNIKK